tara:strand:+ start:5230 stop:6558 length:1329 start_codon:yes stop_codon:yes gene_type:complete
MSEELYKEKYTELDIYSYKTKKGTKYRVKVYIGKDYKGNVIRKGQAWDTLQEARIERAKLQDAKYTGEVNPSSFVNNRDKLSVLIDYWFENNKDMNEHSLRAFRVHLGRLKTDMGKVRADAFTKPVFIKYMREVFNQGIRKPSRKQEHLHHTMSVGDEYKQPTKKRHIYTLKKFFRDMVTEGLLSSNPTDGTTGILAPPDPNYQSRRQNSYLIPEQQKALITYYTVNNVSTRRNKTPDPSNPVLAYLATLLYTGMRPQEALNLKWKDIDFVNSTIFVQKGKTQTARRKIPMFTSHYPIMKEFYDERKNGDYFYLVDPEAYVFTYIVITKSKLYGAKFTGKRFSQYYVGGRFKHFLKAIGEEANGDLYMLRHTHASLLINSGASLDQIMKRMGHTSIDTTIRNYGHWYDYKQEELIEKAEQELSLASDSLSETMSEFMKKYQN